MAISGHATQPAIYGTVVAFTIVSGLVVTARLVTRMAIIRQPGLDDLFITIGCVFTIAMAAAICMQGMHMPNLPEGLDHAADNLVLRSSIRHGSPLDFTSRELYGG